MTTIAYRAGIVASDSRALCGLSISPGAAKKLFVSEKHGCIFAVSGGYTRALNFVRILESLERMPWHDERILDLTQDNEVEDFDVFAVQWDGRAFHIENGHFSEVTGEFYAMGSGSQAALAAMNMGADALRAVQIASLIDAGTDDRIVCYGINELKKPAYLTARARSPKPRSRAPRAQTSRPKSRPVRKAPA